MTTRPIPIDLRPFSFTDWLREVDPNNELLNKGAGR